jgi:hypothetical protein
MSTLQERLDRIRAGFLAQAPEEVRAVMTRATEDLRHSGILDGIPRPGSELPPFDLPDTEGNPLRSADLLARGPLVLSFYRGHW